LERKIGKIRVTQKVTFVLFFPGEAMLGRHMKLLSLPFCLWQLKIWVILKVTIGTISSLQRKKWGVQKVTLVVFFSPAKQN
jgi:hypothetical protein